MDMGQDALRAMRRARAALVMEQPFFGEIALRLAFREDSSARDLWTDGRVLGFNPVWAATLPTDRLMAAQAHEVLHVALGHNLRRGARDKALWNRACDYVVNGLLLDAGFKLPGGYAWDQAYVGLSADEVFAALQRDAQGGGRGGEARDGARPRPAGEDGDSAPLPGGKTLGGGQQETRGGDRSGRGKSGRSAGGSPAARGKKATRPGDGDARREFTGEVRDLPGLAGRDGSEARRAAEREAEASLTRALNAARNMGGVPAGLERLLRHAPRATLAWRDILRRFLERCAQNDYTWAFPNRRYLYQGIYMPSRQENRLPLVAMAVDCSGSVDRPTLDRFCAELVRVLDAFDTTLTVLFHDTEVHGAQTITRLDGPVALKPVGGGGTDFRPVPGHLERMGISPICLVWFTDLECSLFPEAPPYPVLWVSTGKPGKTVPFGEILDLRDAAVHN